MADVNASDTLTLTERRTKLQIDGTYGAALTEETPDVGVPATDTLTVTDLGANQNPGATDAFVLSESTSVDPGAVATASDTFTLAEGDNQTKQTTANVADITLTESVGVAQSVTETGTLDEVASVSSVPAGVTKFVTDTGTLSESVALALAVVDVLTLAESVSVKVTATDTAALAEAIEGIALAASDTVVLTSTVVEGGPPLGYKTVTDTLALVEGVLALSLSATDTITLKSVTGFDADYTGQAQGRVSIASHMAGTVTVD